MDALIVHPKDEEQLVALKAVMTAMKVAFEQKSYTYPDHVISGVKESIDRLQKKQLTPYKGGSKYWVYNGIGNFLLSKCKKHINKCL